MRRCTPGLQIRWPALDKSEMGSTPIRFRQEGDGWRHKRRSRHDRRGSRTGRAERRRSHRRIVVAVIAPPSSATSRTEAAEPAGRTVRPIRAISTSRRRRPARAVQLRSADLGPASSVHRAVGRPHAADRAGAAGPQPRGRRRGRAVQLPDGCPDLVGKAQGHRRQYDKQVILAPYPGMKTSIALTAWTRLDAFDEFDESRITRFIDGVPWDRPSQGRGTRRSHEARGASRQVACRSPPGRWRGVARPDARCLLASLRVAAARRRRIAIRSTASLRRHVARAGPRARHGKRAAPRRRARLRGDRLRRFHLADRRLRGLRPGRRRRRWRAKRW